MVDSRQDGMEVPDLFRNLSWYLVCAYGVFVGLLPVAEVESTEDEREGDAKPHEQ